MRIEPVVPVSSIGLERDLPEVTAPAPVPTGGRHDYFVLSNAAYEALVTVPRLESALTGAFALSLGGANGNVRVSPGAAPGMLHVSVEVQQLPSWPPTAAPLQQLRLEADLRTSWVVRATASATGPDEAARHLAEAMYDLAQLPGQQVVKIDAEPIENLWPPDSEAEPAAA